jgi:large subunit ribosomal protein L13
MIIVDATDMIAGRLATYVAKQAILGNEMRVINSEKAVISGKRAVVFDDFLHRIHMGTPRKGPFIQRMPDRLLRRIIRGMIPHEMPKGKEAYSRVLCYVGVPEEFAGKEAVKHEAAHKSKLPNYQYVTLYEISKRIGAKVE